MLLLALFACVQPGAPSDPTQDVRGLYALDWSDAFTVKLDIGGAAQESSTDGEGVVTFEGPDGEPLELDLGAFCADENVLCPSEVWPDTIAIDQDEPAVNKTGHVLHVYDPEAPWQRRDGLVDHGNHQFLIGLDGASGGSGNCGALAVSLAGGTFGYDGGGGPTRIDEGVVAVGWLGVCAWSGLAVAATLSIETTYVGARSGDLPPIADDTGDTGDSGA